MPKVKLYRDLEGAAAGDTVEVDQARATFLVVNGHATYASKADAQGGYVPPVGGQRLKDTEVGVEPTKAQGEKLYARRQDLAARGETLEFKTLEEEQANKPAPDEPPTSDNVGAMVDRGKGKVEQKATSTRKTADK